MSYYVTRISTVTNPKTRENVISGVFVVDSETGWEICFSRLDIEELIKSQKIDGVSEEDGQLRIVPYCEVKDAKCRLLRGYDTNVDRDGNVVTIFVLQNSVVRLSNIAQNILADSIYPEDCDSVTFVFDDKIKHIAIDAFSMFRGKNVDVLFDTDEVTDVDLLMSIYRERNFNLSRTAQIFGNPGFSDAYFFLISIMDSSEYGMCKISSNIATVINSYTNVLTYLHERMEFNPDISAFADKDTVGNAVLLYFQQDGIREAISQVTKDVYELFTMILGYCKKIETYEFEGNQYNALYYVIDKFVRVLKDKDDKRGLAYSFAYIIAKSAYGVETVQSEYEEELEQRVQEYCKNLLVWLGEGDESA